MDKTSRNGAKRRSGNQDSFGVSVERRSSKKSSSSRDRHGRVYPDTFKERTIRTVTPDNDPPNGESPAAFSSDHTPLRNTSTPESRSWSHDLARSYDKASSYESSRYISHSGRGKIFEEPSSDTSPSSATSKVRQRMGSNASSPFSRSLDEYSSIGYPSVVPTGFSSSSMHSQNRQRLVKSPPHPLSPTGLRDVTRESTPLSPTMTADSAKILQLMNITCGRMNGILFFRTPDSPDWSSGYCAINVASGSLIYQEQKKSGAIKKTLMPDLRGCNVQTKIEEGTQYSYLSVSASSSRLTVQLRPPVPETFDSWLAALLCWQPLAPSGIQGKLPKAQPSAFEARPRAGRRASDGSIGRAAIIKVGKLLLWMGHQHKDPSASGSSALERPFTSSWRRVSFILHDNGQFKLLEEDGGQTLLSIDLPSLSRSAIQQLDRSVLDIEYSIAIYWQYSIPGATQVRSKPVFFGIETRILYEVLFVLLRAFATPILYSASHGGSASDSGSPHSSPGQYPTQSGELFRVERQLDLRLTEAKLRSPPGTRKESRQTASKSVQRLLGDSYAEVLLDGEVRARTAVKTGQPFWREDFTVFDIPPSISSASILMRARDPSEKEWTMVAHEPYGLSLRDGEPFSVNGDIEVSSHDRVVGEANLQLDDLARGEENEQWWSLIDPRGQVCGEMLMKVRLTETVVLLAKDYKAMSDLLHTFSNRLTLRISHILSNETKRLSEVLLNIYQVSGSTLDWLQALIEEEIDGIGREDGPQSLRHPNRMHSQESYESASEREMLVREVGRTATLEANLLFRGNSLLTYSLDAHCRRLGREYLEETLGPKLREIDDAEPNCEVDPNRIDNPQELDKNWKTLVNLTTSVWRVIQASATRCPPEMRLLFRHIRSCAEDRYGDWIRTVSYSSVSGFLFLRFFCPAILNPKLFNLMKEHPRSSRSSRALLLITKSLQGLANMTTFGSKEPWMEPMNKFLNLHRVEFKDFIDRICDISVERPSIAVSPSYATPIQILGRLPPTSREGFPSLPFLLDSARNFAELVLLWLHDCPPDIEGQGPGNKALSAFHQVCLELDERTKERVNQAEQAERPNGDLESKWERLLEDRVRSSSNPYSSEPQPYFGEMGSYNFAAQGRQHHRNSVGQFGHRALSPPFQEASSDHFDDTPPSSASVTWERQLPPNTKARPNEPQGGSVASSKNSSVLSLDPSDFPRRRQTPVSREGSSRTRFRDLVVGPGRKKGKEKEQERDRDGL